MADNVDNIVTCPACGKEMEKVFMTEQGIYLDVCTQGCGGVLFDNRELKKFDEGNEDITPLLKALEGKTFIKVDESDIRVCPVCGWKMVKNYSSINQDIQIDECYGCGTKFLDYGELNKFRDEFKTEEDRADAAVMGLYKTIGVEMEINQQNFESRMQKQSMTSKLANWNSQRNEKNTMAKSAKLQEQILNKLDKYKTQDGKFNLTDNE